MIVNKIIFYYNYVALMHEKNHRSVETIMLIIGLRVMKDD